ncbi:uncharacterized protein LOC112504377 [Cynara cardunculus var. scolymus]|uniref:uncharacterized protein LOC112504377 n=1 Tax=Cynara cardunculus var. scolymus TaxID=59895 RepID=UPI000D626DBD|nr:uncharacterized protein LOC112504377 [Cynara cardunculus var. scolymus]
MVSGPVCHQPLHLVKSSPSSSSLKLQTTNLFPVLSPQLKIQVCGICALCKIMAGGNFVHRVVSYLVNEVLVESLANSRTFQRFAVKTSKSVEEISSMAAKKRQEIAEQVKEMSRNFESKNH